MGWGVGECLERVGGCRRAAGCGEGGGGDYELREITPIAVEDFRERMNRAKVGPPTQRKALMLLQGILRRAVVRSDRLDARLRRLAPDRGPRLHLGPICGTTRCRCSRPRPAARLTSTWSRPFRKTSHSGGWPVAAHVTAS